MTDMKSKDAIKLDIIQLGKSKTYPEENEIPEDIFYRYLHQPRVYISLYQKVSKRKNHANLF